MSKANIWSEVQAVLEAQAKLPKGLKEALEAILKPKSGSTGIHAPQEIDGVMHYYCRFHQAYEPESDIVMSGGKSKGYCKASISIWNKRNASIKKKEAEISELVLVGDFVQAQECSVELQALKAQLNEPTSYDIVSDWSTFRAE